MNVLLPLLLVPAATLGWRVIYSKSRLPRRAAGAAAAMLTLVGAFAAQPAPGENVITTMRLHDVRDGVALLAASAGSIYLLLWSMRQRGRARNKTISILAAVVGLVPVVASIFVATIYPE